MDHFPLILSINYCTNGNICKSLHVYSKLSQLLDDTHLAMNKSLSSFLILGSIIFFLQSWEIKETKRIPCLLLRLQATLHLSAHALLAIGFVMEIISCLVLNCFVSSYRTM